MSGWQIFYSMLALSAAGVSAGLAYFGWKRRKSESGLAFMGFALSLMIWALFYSFEMASSTPAVMMTFNKLMYGGVVSVAPSWFVFALCYTGNNHWLSRRRILLLWIVPIIVLGFVFTNEFHHLLWQSTVYFVDPHLGFMRSDSTYGPVFWMHMFYSYVLLLLATVLLARVGMNAVRQQQRQAMILLISVFIPWASNIIFVTRSTPLGGMDITPIAFTIAGALIGWVIVRFRALENIPIAREAIIEGMEDGVLLFDLEHYALDVNHAGKVMCGITNDVLGKSVYDAFSQHPSVLELYLELTQTDRRRDETIMGNMVVQITISDVNNRMGDKAGYVVMIHNITHRKQAEQEIARRVAELRALRDIDARISSSLNIAEVLDNALTSAIHMTGADAGFIALTEADGLRLVQCYGRYDRLGIGTLFPKTLGIVGRTIRTGMPVLVQDVKQDVDYYRDVEETAAEIAVPLVAHDRIIGILNLETPNPLYFQEAQFEFVKLLAGRIATAIENAQLYETSQYQLQELQKLYDHVKDLEQMKTDMIRIATHDLRNPLSNIRGYLDLLQIDHELMTDEHVMYVNTMVSQAKRMEQLIRDILSLERYQTQAIFEDVDIQLMVMAAISDYEVQAEQKDLSLVIDVPLIPMPIEADHAQLREAISNLITNAIKYTPQKGKITVSLVADEEYVTFKVIDTGYGVPESEQEKLFSPFYRAKSDETADIEGTGLGLHLVKNIVNRHYGRVIFESVYTQGSTFGFELPRFPQKPL